MSRTEHNGRVQEKKGAPPPKPVLRRVAISDATVEAASLRLHENPRGLLLNREELSGWAESLNAYRNAKGADRQFFLSVWSSMPITVDRKTEDEPLFSIIRSSPSRAPYSPIRFRPWYMKADVMTDSLTAFCSLIQIQSHLSNGLRRLWTRMSWGAVDKLFQQLYGLQFAEDGKAEPICLFCRRQTTVG